MTEQLQIYKCNICGNIIEVLHTGASSLVCCDEPMVKLDAKAADEGKEKHVPVIEQTPEGIKVKIGSVPHPMEEKHHIEWIEIIADGRTCKKFLNAGDAPEALFCIKADKITAREHCNVHGLWKG